MSMKTLDEMWDIVSDHIEEITDDMRKKGVTRDNLELADTATHTLKNICAVTADESGYSQAGDWEARGRFGDQYAREGYNENGNNYGGRRRDSMGRYSREGGMYDDGMSQRRSMSRRSYSRGGVMEHLEAMEDEAETEEQREEIRRFKKKMETMR